MHIEEHRWHSPQLGQEMIVKVYGHWGLPLVVFPCSRGRYFDFEGMGMIAAISDRIDSGRIKLFCIDSVDDQSWYNFAISPGERNARHEAYDRYVVHEVIPFVRHHCQSPWVRPSAVGCSMGAYHAVNIFLKHPDLFGGTIALSGLYRLDREEFQISTDQIPDVYYNSPLTYIPGLSDHQHLDRCRDGRIIVCVGQGAWEDEAIEDTRDLDTVLRAKSIPAWVDFWGYDVNHDWPWWYKQMNYFLERLY
jgi:esterase/lipase superfamily enzyme